METLGHLTPSTRRGNLSAVRTFCRWMVRNKKIKGDPTVGIEPVREPRSVPRALTSEQARLILLAVPDQRMLTVAQLMLGCGLRCGEVARLEVGDYDRATRTLRAVGKGEHERVLPVPSTVASTVDLDLAQVGAQRGPLIGSQSDPRFGVTPDRISKPIHRPARSAFPLGRRYPIGSRWPGRKLHDGEPEVFDSVYDLEELVETDRFGDIAVGPEFVGAQDIRLGLGRG
jgi:integrase